MMPRPPPWRLFLSNFFCFSTSKSSNCRVRKGWIIFVPKKLLFARPIDQLSRAHNSLFFFPFSNCFRTNVFGFYKNFRDIRLRWRLIVALEAFRMQTFFSFWEEIWFFRISRRKTSTPVLYFSVSESAGSGPVLHFFRLLLLLIKYCTAALNKISYSAIFCETFLELIFALLNQLFLCCPFWRAHNWTLKLMR